MTPELRQQIGRRARGLQARIRPETLHALALATEAHGLFEEATDELRCRWLTLELAGYGAHQARPLSELLRVLPNDRAGARLVAHVAGYRTQRGMEVSAGSPSVEVRHFFVESLEDLVATEQKLSELGSTGAVALGLDGPGGRRSVEFARDVFVRVLTGFQAALHLQLGDLAR